MRTPRQTDKSKATKKTITVLCIDDDATGLRMRKLLLESRGFRVLAATNGEEGLNEISSSRVDAVVLDYAMPLMDGAEVARSIRKTNPNLPIVMLSGYPGDIPDDALNLVNAFVTKGGAPEQLFMAVDGALRAKRSGRITILNVDDNEEYRYAVTRVLRARGFDVLEAKSGREALELASSKPGLIILDVNLPDMLGFDVCRQLKSSAATRNIPVIHISATYSSESAVTESKDSGAVRFVEHPQDLSVVVQAVQEELRKVGRR